MLRCEATLPLSKELKHDYVGLTVIEMDSAPVGLSILALGLFLGLKSKISHKQNVKQFQLYIRLSNFKLLGSIIIKKSKSRPIPYAFTQHPTGSQDRCNL